MIWSISFAEQCPLRAFRRPERIRARGTYRCIGSQFGIGSPEPWVVCASTDCICIATPSMHARFEQGRENTAQGNEGPNQNERVSAFSKQQQKRGPP